MARTPHTPERDALRREVEGALFAEVERVGPDKISVRTFARQFLGRGTSEKTIARWIDAAIKSGRISRHLTRKVKEAVAKRQAQPDPEKTLVEDLQATVPALVSPADIAGRGVVDAIGYIQKCIGVALRVIEHAETPDGGIRLTKTALAASEHLRRCLETAVRLSEGMRNLQEADRFFSRVMEEIAKEAPEVAERILMRLSDVATEFGA